VSLRKTAIALGVAIFGSGVMLFGKELVSPLTWERCVSIALQQNPDLASARAGKEASVYSYRGSYNGILPSVTLSNSVTESNGSDPAQWQAEASANLNIIDASAIAGIKSASAQVGQAEARQRLASSQLRLDLRRAFLRRLFDDEDIEVSLNIQALRHKSAELVALRYASGRESKGNRLRAEAQNLQATAELAQARRRIRADQRELYRQLGWGNVDDTPVQGALSVDEPPALLPPLSPVVEKRPDVLLQEASVNVAQADVKRAKSPLWPTVSAGYSRFRRGESEFPSDESGWIFRGLLDYPLFGGGLTSTYYNVAESQKNLEKANRALQSIRDQAMADLETAWSAYATAAENTRVQAALLAAARQRNAEADIRYNSGLLSYDNWEIIITDRVNQERQAIQSQLTAATAQAVWEFALGKTLEE
jgi:outer membrane protein TolC